MLDLLSRPWPWYVAGPLIGLFAPLLLLVGNRLFGMSSNLRHACAACFPSRTDFLRYDWREAGGWNLAFAGGTVVGGFIAGWLLANPDPVAISAATMRDLATLGITDFTGLVPSDLFRFEALLTVRGLVLLVIGGFLIGFGTAWAGGCTSGHALSGVADLQPASFLAMIAFFVGGMIGTHLLLPLVFP